MDECEYCYEEVPTGTKSCEECLPIVEARDKGPYYYCVDDFDGEISLGLVTKQFWDKNKYWDDQHLTNTGNGLDKKLDEVYAKSNIIIEEVAESCFGCYQGQYPTAPTIEAVRNALDSCEGFFIYKPEIH
jgi:hypothetical protein